MKAREFNLGGYRLVICLGPGGVGKTTLSAAFALNAALAGRNVNVMTVDPPRVCSTRWVSRATRPSRATSLWMDSGRGADACRPSGSIPSRPSII